MKNYRKKAESMKAKCGTEVKYIKNPDSIILKSQRDVVLSAGEDNDCVVHAVAHVFGFGYKKAHDFCREFYNRKKGRGVFGFRKIGLIDRRIKYASLKDKYFPKHKITEVRSTNSYRVRCEWTGEMRTKIRNMTLKSFLKNYPTGRYLLAFSDHAIAIIDGVVVGTGKGDPHRLRRPIEVAFEVK